MELQTGRFQEKKKYSQRSLLRGRKERKAYLLLEVLYFVVETEEGASEVKKKSL